jgi:hypothetical protein
MLLATGTFSNVAFGGKAGVYMHASHAGKTALVCLRGSSSPVMSVCMCMYYSIIRNILNVCIHACMCVLLNYQKHIECMYSRMHVCITQLSETY